MALAPRVVIRLGPARRGVLGGAAAAGSGWANQLPGVAGNRTVSLQRCCELLDQGLTRQRAVKRASYLPASPGWWGLLSCFAGSRQFFNGGGEGHGWRQRPPERRPAQEKVGRGQLLQVGLTSPQSGSLWTATAVGMSLRAMRSTAFSSWVRRYPHHTPRGASNRTGRQSD